MNHLVLALVLFTVGCLWDSDTLRDEAKLRPGIWEVISDQFPRHGTAYYEARIRRIGALATPSRAERNDLAVAHIRLQQHAPAERILQDLRRERPDEYEALSNQAVLWRNQGRFADTVPLFERALVLRPDGHLGLGD